MWPATILSTADAQECAVLLNTLVDPYLIFNMPRVAGLNSRKPAVESQQYLIKAYEVLRTQPRTLITASRASHEVGTREKSTSASATQY